MPFEASRGGAETMYPEYRKKLKQMVIPRAKVFDVQFEQEHQEEGRGQAMKIACAFARGAHRVACAAAIA